MSINTRFRRLFLCTVIITTVCLSFMNWTVMYIVPRCQNFERNADCRSPQWQLAVQRGILEEAIHALVAEEIQGITLEDGKSLDELIMESGGQPIRVLLVAHWRSGSTFAGDLLASHPGVYYISEPLSTLLSGQVREGPMAPLANFILKQIMMCRYDLLDRKFFQELTQGFHFFNYNQRLIGCNETREACSDVDFLCKTCRDFPVQVLKTVKYRLDSVRSLLEDKTLGNLRVVYLIRDPRGMINSRSQLKADWCMEERDCNDAGILCRDLAKEYHVAQDLKRQFPERFTVLRYETLARDPFNTTQKLFKDLHLSYTNQTQEFLKSHTSLHDENPFSTMKDSKSTVVRWLRELSLNATLLRHIEDSCQEAMNLWRYVRITNHYRKSINWKVANAIERLGKSYYSNKNKPVLL